MCYHCYEEKFGKPTLVNEKTKALAKLIADVYECGNDVGGNLHAIVDDWNLEDEHIVSEIETPRDKKFWQPPETDHDVEQRCLEALRDATLEERASALALYDEYLNEDGTLTELPPDTSQVAFVREVTYASEPVAPSFIRLDTKRNS